MLAKIKRQYKDPVSDNPYVGFKVWVSVGQSNTPVTLYGDRLGNTVIGQGVINTDQDGKVEFYVDDNNEYTLRLVHPVSGYVMSKEQGVDPKSDSVKTDELTPDEISQVRALVQTGGTTGQAFIQFKEEGTNLGTLGTVTAVNFVGDGVVATRTGNEVTITIDGGIDEVPPAADIALIDSGSYFASDNVEDALQQVGGALQTVNTTLEALGTAAQADTSDFAPASHDHAIANITGLQTALDSKQADIQFQDSGVNVGTAGAVSTINFTGDATLSLNGAELTINVTGGGGGGSNEAGDITITDTADYYTSSNVEGALQEVGQKLSNIDSTLSGLGSAAQAETTDFAAASHVGAGGTSHAVVVSGGAAGFMTGTDKQKLDGIAAGATANSADATLLNRANHTGTQAISTVTGLQAALDAKAPLASPALTGTPTAPTATAGTNTTQLATTAFVQAAVAALVDTAPGTLDTLNELAAALGDDPNFASTISTQLGLKANINSPTFTGTPSAPTAAVGTDTTQLATTAYVLANAASTTPASIGTAAVGTSTRHARADHVHAHGNQSGGSLHSVATTSTNGFMSSTDKQKLDGIAAGATANSADSILLNRANHTGTQAISTVSGLQTALDAKAPSTLTVEDVAGTSYTLVAADNGKIKRFTSGSAVSVTVPTGLGSGFSCTLVQGGAGAVTVAAGASATLNSMSGDLTTSGQHATISIIPVATNSYLAVGAVGDFVTAVYNAMKSIVVDGSNITTTDNDGAKTMTFAASGGGGGGSGDVVGPASSVDSEIALYDGTTGKLLKRASGNGLAVLTNGVLSTVTNTLTTLPINEQTASYTLVIGDAGRQVDMNSASANSLTIPPDSSVAFPVDTVIAVCQMGAGATTIVAGPGVTIQKPASRTLVLAEQYEVVYLHKKATDTWRVIGGLGAA